MSFVLSLKKNPSAVLPWILLTGIYAPVFYTLYTYRWAQIDYTHAYYVLPLSLWVAWQKRRTLGELYAACGPLPADPLGLTAIVVALLMFILGWRQDYLVITTISLIPLLWGITRHLYGPSVAKALSFPLLYLLFLVPPPMGMLDSITLPMRYGISAVAEAILHGLHYPIDRNGLLLSIGGKDIFMGAPCSGMRSLTTMFALAVAYVHLTKANTLKKTVLIASALPLALIGNLLRVMALCLITYYAGKEAAEGFFHYFTGAVIFLFMIGGLMGLEFLVDRLTRRVP